MMDGTKKANGPSLLLCGVRKSFADVKAVDGLDLEVARGEGFGLLGPNGGGKFRSEKGKWSFAAAVRSSQVLCGCEGRGWPGPGSSAGRVFWAAWAERGREDHNH